VNQQIGPEPAVEASGLTIGWPGALLLEDGSFDVKAGEIFAILGRSGSGKSTLLRHLIGLATPIRGRVTLLGRAPVAERSDEPPRFGVTFQSGALLASLTVGDNVGLPLRHWTPVRGPLLDALVAAKLAIVGLPNVAEQLPSELSGGMRTRAAIARAMALEPSILFLDEPTAGLDPIATAEFDDLLLALNRALGLTVVLVTHDLATVLRIVGRCILVDRASRSIIASGDPRALMEEREDERVHRFFHASPAEEVHP
jgi:phospholipid/cholesterol/gamma-HCH transport system ATP-binding protein